MNVLGCLDQPTSGQYILGGQDISALPDDELSEIRSRRIGFIFQNFNLIQQLTVLENLEVPMFYLGIPPDRAPPAGDGAGGEGGPGRPRRPPPDAALRRAAAARLHRPRADQRPAHPAGRRADRGLDSKTGQQILELFDELVAQGKTIILVTHDPSVAHRCSRVIHLHDGRVSKDERNAKREVHVEGGQLAVRR